MPDTVSPSEPFPFLFPEDAAAFRRDGLPAAATETVLTPEELEERLRPAANDTFTDLLVIGWAAGALDLLLADSVLVDKRITWVVEPGQAAHLAGAWSACARRPQLAVAVCSDRAQLPAILEQLPSCWSLAVLDQALCPPGELHLLGKTRFQRGIGSADRLIGDLRHLWQRLPRLGEAIPLAAWKQRYAGRSALCLAAGPSLDRHIDFIRAHQDRCVVIAVDVLQKRLDERGIKVDFVLNVDSDDRLADRLAPPRDPDTVLVMPVMGHRAMDAVFPRRSFFGHGLLARWLLGEDHTFPTGTTVGIASVGFAHFIGCRETVLIGHDLSFSDTAYYSDLVAGKEVHQQQMAAESNLMRRQVPGNGDRQVATDYLFEVGIQDLGMMLQRLEGFSAWNMNCNTGEGARIPHTAALPDGWMPAGEGAVPRPDSPARLADDMHPDLRRLVPEFLGAHLDNCLACWRQAGDGHIAAINDQILRHPAAAIGANLLSLFVEGVVLHDLRLYALPPSIGTAWHHVESRRLLDRVLDAGRTFYREIFGDNDRPLEGRRTARELSEIQRRFLVLVMNSVKDSEDSPADAVLMPPACRYFRNLCDVLPDLGLPVPQSAQHGLQVIRNLFDKVPDAFVTQTLCLCALEEATAPLGWARETGYLPADRLPAPDGGERCRQVGVELDATDAVLRIRSGRTASLKADAGLACRWWPCHLHLLRALLQRGDAGVEQVERLLRRGDVVPDDQMIAIIVLHVADFRRAANLIAPFTKALGEASQLAMASRCQETGDLDRAQRYAGTIRALSRFKDQARVVVCSCRLAAGAWDQAEEEARRIHHHDLREQMLHRCRSGRQGLAASHEAVLSSTVLPDPAVVGQLIAGAWEQRDGERLVALQRLLLDRTRQAGQEAYAAEYRELHGGLEVMLRHLGIDPRAQVLDVRCVNLTRELTGLVATRHTQGRMVDADESLFMSGLVDSLGIAEIAAHISRVGGITLTGTDIVEQDLDSIRKLVAHVRSRIA